MDRYANELRCGRCVETVDLDDGAIAVARFAIRHHSEHNYDGDCIVCRHDDSTFADVVLALVRQVEFFLALNRAAENATTPPPR